MSEETKNTDLSRLMADNARMKRALTKLASNKPIFLNGLGSPQSDVRMQFALIAATGGEA